MQIYIILIPSLIPILVYQSHIDTLLVISSNHMALKFIYMMSESQIYITNIDLLSSRLGYPTADQHLKLNVPQVEFQMALSLHKCAPA